MIKNTLRTRDILQMLSLIRERKALAGKNRVFKQGIHNLELRYPEKIFFILPE